MQFKTEQRKYVKVQKPPYPYVGLITLAIQSSERKRLRLGEIVERLAKMFPEMNQNGISLGWKDSVRHNLSKNDFFQLDYEEGLMEPYKSRKGSQL